MKRVFTVFWFLPLLAVAQKTFIIEGNITGLTNKALVFLSDANNPDDTLTTVVSDNGRFTLKGTLPQPGLYNINFADAKKKALLFLDNSNVTIHGDIADVKKIKVQGSPSHNDFEYFQQQFNPWFEQINKMTQQINNVGITDSLTKAMQKAVDTVQAELDKFIQKRNGSYVSPFILLVTSQLSGDMVLLENRFTKLTAEVQQSYYGKYVKGLIDDSKIGAVGTPAIEFTQNDTTGTPVSLASFKGRYVLVDFWASWCGPCRKENPNVVNMYRLYKNKNFTVLGVSLDRAKDPWLQAIKDDDLTWTHVSDLKFWNNEVAVKYKIQSIPQNFLIDPNGTIIARNLRGHDLVQRLGELLK